MTPALAFVLVFFAALVLVAIGVAFAYAAGPWVADDPAPEYSALDRLDGLHQPRPLVRGEADGIGEVADPEDRIGHSPSP